MSNEVEDLQDIATDKPGLSADGDGDGDSKLDRETVSKIVARERQKAYEKAKQELIMEQEQQLNSQGGQQPNSTFGGMAAPQMTQEDIQKLIAEQVPQYLQTQANEYQQKQFVDAFINKMQAAEERYPGLEQKLNELDFTKPNTIALARMANNMENTGDIMNELLENPEKMGNLLMLMHEQPKLAQQKIASLSNSIKTNQEALANNRKSQDPIAQIKSSANAGVDEGSLSLRDLKKLVSSRK